MIRTLIYILIVLLMLYAFLNATQLWVLFIGSCILALIAYGIALTGKK